MRPTGVIRAFGVVFGARMVSAAAAFLATILVARVLGPERFGPYAVLLATINVGAGLMSPAIDTAMVRFAAQGRETGLTIIAYAFRIKAGLAVATFLAGLALALPLHRLLLANIETEAPGPSAFVVVFAAAAVMVMWASVQSWCQAEQRFHRWAVQEAITSVLRLAWIAAVLFIGGLGERSLLAGYGVAAGIVALAGAWGMPRAIWRMPRPDAATRYELFQFTQWVVLACLATSLAQRLDVFLLAAFEATPLTLGHYGAALNLALIGELAIMTLFHVLLPKASALTDPAEWQTFLKRHQRRAVAIGILLLPVSAFGGYLAAIVFGEDYAGAGPYFGALLVGTAFVLSSAPAGAVLYAAGKSRVIAQLEIVKLVATAVAGLLALPFFGAFGLACAMAGVRAGIAVLTYIAARRVIARTLADPAGTSA